MEVVQLNESCPPEWHGFAQRWLQWWQQFDRTQWQTSWQGQAWQKGYLRFPSPWDDGELRTQLSVRRHLVFGYVLQQKDYRALIIPEWPGGGHELEAVYLLREQILLLLSCSLAPAHWFLMALAELLPQLVTTTPWPRTMESRRARRLILEGHPNFAHQLLNVLPGLEDLTPEISNLQWIGHQPLAPMVDLYPERTWAPQDDIPTPGSIFELPLSQGPARISRRARRRLREYCQEQISERANGLLEQLKAWRRGGKQVLWISLKTRGAWAKGLPQLVSAWMNAMAKEGKILPLVLLDGFSPQHSDTQTSIHYGSKVATLVNEEHAQADQIQAALKTLGMTVLKAIGLSLADSIALGQEADSYLCHQGTVQHKLGWCQDSIPGIIHSGSWRSRQGKHAWGGMGGVAPLWLPSAFSEDLASGPRAAYRFREERIQEAADWLVKMTPWRSQKLSNS